MADTGSTKVLDESEKAPENSEEIPEKSKVETVQSTKVPDESKTVPETPKTISKKVPSKTKEVAGKSNNPVEVKNELVEPEQAPPDFSDESLIKLMMSKGKTQHQADCSLALLRYNGYNDEERYRIMNDPKNYIHLLSYFGCVWPSIAIIFVLILIAVGLIMKLYYDIASSPCDKTW